MGGGDGMPGSFEEQVLLAVAHLGDRPYGMTVRREIEGRTGAAVSIGAVYATLDRLDGKGWITSAFEGGDDARGGRARKIVRLTPEGTEALRRAREVHTRMWDGLDLASLPGEERT